jgi:hypothetical protein
MPINAHLNTPNEPLLTFDSARIELRCPDCGEGQAIDFDVPRWRACQCPSKPFLDNLIADLRRLLSKFDEEARARN